MAEAVLPRSYINRKFHSLAGIWLVLFLLEHLITNSLAGLYIGDWGEGFVRMVNDIHDLPYLQAVEILLLGLPLLVHGILGLKYLMTSKSNSFKKANHQVSLPKYARNHTYTFQRLTSWVLLVGIVLHVIQMRFLEYPMRVNGGIDQQFYMVKLKMDPGLYKVAPRVSARLYSPQQIQKEKERLMMHTQTADSNFRYDPKVAKESEHEMVLDVFQDYVHKLSKKQLDPNQVIAVTKSFGAATLLSVRDTFKSPLMITLYTIFVITACFHAFNGLWTAMISWGLTLTARSQQVMMWISVSFSVLLALLGLSAVWLTYFVNLR